MDNLIFDGFRVGRQDDDVAVIIDGGNISYMTRKLLGANIDYSKLSKILNANLAGIRSMTYVVPEILTRDEDKIPSTVNRDYSKHGYSQIRGLLRWLEYNRYTVISRQIVQHEDHEGAGQQKNFAMDVEITMALYQASRYVKHIVFIGSSAKYAPVLRDLRNLGMTITVMGVKKPDNSRTINMFYTADELRTIDNFIDLSHPFFAKHMLEPRVHNSQATEGSFTPDVSNTMSNLKNA